MCGVVGFISDREGLIVVDTSLSTPHTLPHATQIVSYPGSVTYPGD